MPAMFKLLNTLILLFTFSFQAFATPTPSESSSLISHNAILFSRDGSSKQHNAAKAKEAAAAGQLPWNKLRCACTVSEEHVPVVGDMGWHFDLRITGFGDNKKEDCGKGVLDNLHGECHTKIDIRQWYCDRKGDDRHISWDSSKTFMHQGVEMALWRSSYEQMGGCKCDYNYAKSTVQSVFSGLSMAIPIPGVGAAVGVAKTVATAIATGVKGAVSGAKAAVGAAVKGVAKAPAKVAGKLAGKVGKENVKEGVKNQQQQKRKRRRYAGLETMNT
ncbi:hypothetical protein MMC15_005508 [Xylographa vitiligo]|nr:hypothetical protein [Xylographa vitiligo]